VLGSRATPAWNMPLLAPVKTSTSAAGRTPKRRATARQKSVSESAQRMARAWRSAKKGLAPERSVAGSSRSTSACTSMYTQERSANSGEYSQVCMPVPRSR